MSGSREPDREVENSELNCFSASYLGMKAGFIGEGRPSGSWNVI
jgi:hypothetical protein